MKRPVRALYDAFIRSSILTLLLLSGAAPSVAENPPQTFADGLLQLLDDSCLTLGNNPDGLGRLAKTRGWAGKSPDELAKLDNAYTRLVAGWTFNDALTSYALIQSAGRDSSNLFVCSITTKLPVGVDASMIKLALETRYATKPEWDIERTGSQSFRYRVPGADKMPIGITLHATPATSILTLRCLHGPWPARSTQAASNVPSL